MDDAKITRADLETNSSYILLSSLLVSDYHLQLVEKLKGTNMYKGHFRNGLNLVVSELKRKLDFDVPHILNLDDSSMYSIQDAMEELFIEVATTKPDFIGVIVQMIKMLKEEPQKILDFLDIQFTDPIQTR